MKCASCKTEEAVGKSKYCELCKAKATETFWEKRFSQFTKSAIEDIDYEEWKKKEKEDEEVLQEEEDYLSGMM